MKRKISILTLAFLFFAATTGVPITLHICKIMGTTSSEFCEMHKANVVKHSCCEDEQPVYPVNITSDNSCCQTELVYNKVKDDFVSNKPNVNIFSSSENLFQPVTLTTLSTDFSFDELFYCDSSPPFLINPELHITNSILLI